MLIEVHIIQNHAPSNLNRDDSGSPKSAIFGGYRRARISSQCLKRCYRTSKTFREAVDELGMHTCSMPDEVMRRALSNGVMLDKAEQKKMKKELAGVVKKGEATGESSGKAEKDGGSRGENSNASKDMKTAQSVFWRERELEALVEAVRASAVGNKKDFNAREALKPVGLNWTGIPVDMALFGRMVTSELMHNVEASSQFAHAISTNEWAREFDLWTRVDDRRDKRLDFYRNAFGAEEKLESGTDGMGDAEFTSACFYSYFNVDFGALVDNLTGKAIKHDLDDSKDRPVAKERACGAVVGLVRAAIFERPTGKFNSMATPTLPTLVLVEVRNTHVPVSYVNAFAKPVDPKNEETQKDNGQIERCDLPMESAKRLLLEASRIAKAFKSRGDASRYVYMGGNNLPHGIEDSEDKKNGSNKPEGNAREIKISGIPYTLVNDDETLIASVRARLSCPKADNAQSTPASST